VIRTAFAAACMLVSSCMQAAATAPDPGDVDARFKAALAQASAGRHEAAAAEFADLFQETGAPRIRLELARSLHLSGRHREALYLFREAVRDPSTPAAVRRNVLPFMEAAELRLVRIRYGIRATTDTNPGKFADGGTVYFNGVPFEYQPPGPSSTAYGIEPWVSVEKLWENGLLTRAYGSARLFEDSDLMTGQYQFAVGREVGVVPGLFVQAALAGEQGKVAGYDLLSLETWKRFRLSDSATFGIGAQVGYMHFRNDAVSGGYYRPYVFADWAVGSRTLAFATLSVEHLDARNDYYTYVAPRATIGAELRAGGLSLTPQLTVTHTAFQQFDAFWGTRREDLTLRPAISVAHDSFVWMGLRPELTVFHERRDSNVAIYDYDQWGGFVSLRNAF
jgi:hypothetical protein